MAGPGLRRPLLALGLVALAAGSYWAVRSWTRVPPSQGVDAEGHHWIGAASPRVTVHEYTDYACPLCTTSSQRMARLVARHPTTLRLVRHGYPRMRCPRIAPYSHCRYARLALCAGDQGRFWEMDAWLFENVARSLDVNVEQAAREVGLDAGKLTACSTAPDTFEHADRDAREAIAAHVPGTPSYVIDGKTYPGAEVFAELDRRL